MKLNHQVIGDQGTPIIILHGLFGSSRNWRGIATALSKQNHIVYTMDMRNHGESPHGDSMTYEEMMQDMVEFLDDQGIESTHIIGHSMGGKIAMWLALNHPERLKQLIVVDIAPVNYNHGFDEIVDALHAVPLGEIKSRKDAEDVLSQTITEVSLRQFLLQNLLLKEGYFCWRVNLDGITRALPDVVAFPDLEGVKPYPDPCLFIAGGASTYISRRNHAAVHAVFPQARIETLNGAGHWPHIEQPEPFMQLVTDFLKS